MYPLKYGLSNANKFKAAEIEMAAAQRNRFN